jgi:TRAP-type C4-dicarboxylate transport system permease small subunit
MIEQLRRMDRAWARGEGWLTVLVLILMVLVAGFAAGVRNLTRFDVAWANEMLTEMEWADSLLRKGTLWLAFLGASLATYSQKHINIDILLRLAPPKAKYTMLSFGGIVAGAITALLVVSFTSAVHLNLTERPVEYEMLGANGPMHVCDATDAQVEALEGIEKPGGFCIMRTVLAAVAVPAETPGAAFQLIVPLMLGVMALRLLGQGFANVAIVLGGPEAIAEAEAAEKRRLAAEQADIHKVDPETSPVA